MMPLHTDLLTPPVAQALEQLKVGLRHLYGNRLQQVIVFGSQARGDAGADSDIDVAVMLEGPVARAREGERTGELLSQILLDTGELPNCVFLTMDDLSHGERLIHRNIRRDGLMLPV